MTQTPLKPLSGKKLVDLIVSAAEDKLAERISILDLRKVAGTTDWFIICESDNTTHNSAIGNSIEESCKEKGTRPWHTEGEIEGRWVLIDFSDVVVHIMLPTIRKYYNLESLWPEAKRTDIPALHSCGEN